MRTALLIVASIVGGLFLVGCSTNNTPKASDLPASTQAVTCSKCQVTWVKQPVMGTKSPTVAYYTSSKRMVCPDCKDAVSNFFTTGTFQHTCKTCGDSMEICQLHDAQ